MKLDMGYIDHESSAYRILHNISNADEDDTIIYISTSDGPTRAYVRDPRALASTDVREYPNCIVLVVDVPGLKSSDINLQIENNNVLVVRGEKKRKKDGVFYSRLERRIGKFMRKFRLPESANKDKIRAICQDGVLTVMVETLPPPEAEKPLMIPVA